MRWNVYLTFFYGVKLSIAGNVKGTTRCTQYQREYTPEKLIDYFEQVIDLIKRGV